MRTEREGSKSGGYVGGFFQLFDWTAKSRKKLFNGNSDSPERSKQGKRRHRSLPATHLQLADEDESGVGSAIKGSDDYSCASSVTDDDGRGAKAPGVVARLMGLDSLPVSNCSEPSSSPCFDNQSLQDAYYHRNNTDYCCDSDFVFSGNLLNEVSGPVKRNMDSKPQRMVTRPIEKFQTEVLPPKSAKSIPITHHKLLSPIKSRGFIPSKDAAHIMETAVKIIEPGVQATSKAKTSLFGSSSVPLKVRDFKEKVEAARKIPLVGPSSVPSIVRGWKEKSEDSRNSSMHAETFRRPVESNAAKYLKGQSLNKSWNGSIDTACSKTSNPEEGSIDLKHKEKSISLAIQAKVNVQKRGMNSSSSQSFEQNEHGEAKSSQMFKSQPSMQKNLNRKPIRNASGVLRQNNQKQNYLVDTNKRPSKPSVSNLQGRKWTSVDPSLGRHRTLRKAMGNSTTGSRKLDSHATESEKRASYSCAKNIPRKKRLIDREFNSGQDQINDNMSAHNIQKTPQPKPVLDRQFRWAEDSKNNGTDVISFTFTAPLTRSIHNSETIGQGQSKNKNASMDNRRKRLSLDTDNLTLSSLGYNVIGGDALSTLLEQKLRELSYKVEASKRDTVKVDSSSSFISVLPDGIHTPSSDVAHTHSLEDVTPKHKRDQHRQLPDKITSQYDTVFFSSNYSALGLDHKIQGLEKMDVCRNDQDDARPYLDCSQPSPVSILEPSFSNDSCFSMDTADSTSTDGCKQCFSSIKPQKTVGSSSLKKLHPVEVDMELSDSASSTSIETMSRKFASLIAKTKHPAKSTSWELEYVKQILSNVELMYREFTLGRARDIINPNLFNNLESRKVGFESVGSNSKLRRKVLFDCVSECLNIRCRQYAGGGCRTWSKGMAMVRRTDRLAEEVYKEISGIRSRGDFMVDEILNKDMSCQNGSWLDFEVDAFEVGVDIEDQLVNSLVNEVINDILGC